MSPVCCVEVDVIIVVQNVILGLRRNDVIVDYQVPNLITHGFILIHVSGWKSDLDCIATTLVVVPNELNVLWLQTTNCGNRGVLVIRNARREKINKGWVLQITSR